MTDLHLDLLSILPTLFRVLNMKEATGQLWGYLECELSDGSNTSGIIYETDRLLFVPSNSRVHSAAIAMEDQVHKQRLQHVQIIQNYCANVTSSFNAQLDAFYAQSTQATQILTRQHEVDAAAIEALKAQVQVVATEQKRLVEVVKTDAREMKALQEKLEAAERERDELSGAVERDIAARTERRREEEMIEKKLLGIVGAKARVIGGAKEGSPAIAVTSEAASSSSASTKPTKRSASPGTSTTDAPVAKKARPDSPADPLNIL